MGSILRYTWVKPCAAIVLSMAIGIFAVQGDNALAAGNYGDTAYSSYAAPNNVSYTEAREKWDWTSSWDACYGGSYHNVEVAATGWVWDVQFVGSPLYWYGPGVSGYLDNYVGERGFPMALLWFNNRYNFDTTISGVWSPDSI